MNNIDFEADDDLFNLDDIDSLFGEGDGLLGLRHHDDVLAADLTGFGFGDNGGGDGDAGTARRSSNNDDGSPKLVVSKPNGTRIYRSSRAGETVGIKLLNQNIDHQQAGENLSQMNFNLSLNELLEHEETISKLLPPEVNKRQVIEVGFFNGTPALYFKWENGITCEEWLDKVRSQQQTQSTQQEAKLTVRLRAAVSIAKTLTQFHQRRVVYNSLSLDNIVLTPFEGNYLATFIDLSDAVICSDEQTFDDRKGVDLMNLGIVLNQLFRTDGGGEDATFANAGRREGGGELTSSSRRVSTNSGGDVPSNIGNLRKRGKQLTPGDGLPLYLRAMVSTLIGAGGQENASQMRYESANAVFEDLSVMATQATNSSDRRNNFFKQIEVDHEVVLHSRLKFPKDFFYGRQVQMSMLMHQLQSATMLGDQPLMALIAGYPGTGKSTLVNQIKKPLADKNGFLIEGKFDKMSARPDEVLASALDSFFANISVFEAGENAYMSMRWRIIDIGPGVSCLYDSIPSLEKFMDVGTVVDRPERRMMADDLLDQRLKYMYCKLISAISCRSQPLVLVLDDLQWADKMTLSVIRMLMTDPDIHHFLLLGCYRENEVNESHMLSTNLNDIREQGINVMTIKVGAIERESANALISDTMCLPPNLCRPLSNAVHRKTGGVIMFILRLLASLNEEGLIWYSINLRQWMFDLQKIERKEMSEDVVKHMTEHMSRLPVQIQLGLKLCACLGPTFEAMILEKARKNADIGDDFLSSCVEDGYLLTEGGSSYKWSHDQVQQAAYELIPLQKREKIHLLIGSRLLLGLPSSEMDRFIFHVADNMNKGANLLDNLEQKHEVAELNLRAGEKLLQHQSYHSAVKYLMAGISLLGDNSWEVNYHLSLRLYDAASEALYVVADYSTLAALAEKPLRYAQCFEDKLITYSNLVRAMSSSGKTDECINTCVSVLSELGEPIPTTINQQIYFEEVAKVQEALIGRSRQDLLSLPVMTDINKLTAMRFLNHMLLVTYASNPALNPIVVFRMVRLTVAYGVCNIAAIAFSCYGAWLASGLNEDYGAAFTMGRVASDLMTKMGSVEMLPRVHAVVYGMINIYKEPWQASLCKHSEAFDAGLHNGDMEYAFSNIAFYHTLALFGCGSNLLESNQSLHKHIQRGLQYKQEGMVKTMTVLKQMTYDLMGIKKNAYDNHFGGLNEDTVIELTLQKKLTAYTRMMYQKIKYVKYMCGDMDAAAKHYDLKEELYANCAGQATIGRTALVLIASFIDGLIGLYFARKHRDDEAKWTSVAETSIALVSKWAKSCSWNFANKLSLLEAEYFFLKDDERAYSCYKASIKQAREHKFNHEEGLAHEKLATYLLHKNRHDEALQHFQNAKKCYAIWHATFLVQRVDKAIAVLSPLCGGSR
ncbi:hypothetical protein ACHAWT_009981 [Skeletonema menzelii]